MESAVLVLWIPGVSTNTIWKSVPFNMPVTRFRVVWGLGDTMESFAPAILFNNVDFPTLGGPTMAIKPDLNVIGFPL